MNQTNTPVGRNAYLELAKLTEIVKLRKMYVRMMRRQWRVDMRAEWKNAL